MKNDSLLLTAGLLGVAAYLLADTPSYASGGSGEGISGVKGFDINNPGNIRYSASNQWVGQTGSQNGFCVFDTLAHGVRAMGILLTNYYNSGSTSIAQIVSRYAPASENDTGAYISDVASRVGNDADEPLSMPTDLVPLLQAMVYHEQGYNPMTDTAVEGYLQT